MDVAPYIEGETQALSPQSRAILIQGIEKYKSLVKLEIPIGQIKFIVLGANGDTGTGYLKEKLAGLFKGEKTKPREIRGKTEAELMKIELLALLPGVAESVLYRNESKNTIENAKTVVEILRKEGISKPIIYIVAGEFTELTWITKCPNKYTIPSVYDKDGNKSKNPFPKFTAAISHLERVMFTFKKVLKKEFPNKTIDLQPVPASIRFGDKHENSQNTLTNETLWLLLNTAAYFLTIYKFFIGEATDSEKVIK